MRRRPILLLALVAGLGVDFLLDHHRSSPAGRALAKQVAVGSPTLDDLASGKLRIIDLTWPLNARGATWPAENYKPFELRKIATLEKNGVLSKSFSMPEHLGTHIDAPNHFEPRQASVDEIDIRDLFAPGVLIDVSGPASMDADYRLSVADLETWEKRHGQIPARAVVLLNTGWGRHFFRPERYRNQDPLGRMHTPGFSAEAVKLLVSERHIRGIGIDTLSVDCGASRDFAAHHALNAAGRYALENLAQLDKLPTVGFYLLIAPIKIETGSGGPTRVFAIVQ